MTYTTIKRAYDIPCKHNIRPDSMHVILACHGFGGNMESVANTMLFESAAREGIQMLAFDFPAHGVSEAPDQMLTVTNCLEDITAVYDYIKTLAPSAEISLFGSSMGANFLLNWISRENKKGSRTVKNVVCRSAAVCLRSIFESHVGEENMKKYRDIGWVEMGSKRKMKVPYAFYRELDHYDVFQLFRKNKEQHFLFLHGTEDETALLADVRRFTHLYKLTLIEIPGGNHHLSGPGEMEKAIFETVSYIR
jgi:pimeloyl-ACP methyl ester carboxylesterase